MRMNHQLWRTVVSVLIQRQMSVNPKAAEIHQARFIDRIVDVLVVVQRQVATIRLLLKNANGEMDMSSLPQVCSVAFATQTDCGQGLPTLPVHDVLRRQDCTDAHIAITYVHQLADCLVSVDWLSCCCVIQRASSDKFLQSRSCTCFRELPSFRLLTSAAHHVHQHHSMCLS